MKSVLLLIFMISAISLQSWGQDVILLRNGDEIEAKVIEVGTTEIKYRRHDNPDGPVYVVKKNEVFMITYENGNKEVFEEEPSPSVSREFSPRLIDKSRGAATFGYILPIPVIALTVASGLSEDFTTGTLLGSAALIIGGVGVPLFVTGPASRLRDASGVEGNPGLRIAGWIAYGLAIADGLVAVGLSASEIGVPLGVGVSIAVLGSAGSVLLAVDASESAKQASRNISGRLTPFYSYEKDLLGNHFHNIGVKLNLGN